MLDLFGNEGTLPMTALRPEAKPHQGTIFEAAAEAQAFANGKPVSQVRIELEHPDKANAQI